MYYIVSYTAYFNFLYSTYMDSGYLQIKQNKYIKT